jgi:hypothetical protein
MSGLLSHADSFFAYETMLGRLKRLGNMSIRVLKWLIDSGEAIVSVKIADGLAEDRADTAVAKAGGPSTARVAVEEDDDDD